MFIAAEQHKLISGNFLTTFSKDYAIRTKMKRNSHRQQEYARQMMIKLSPSEEEATRPVTPGMDKTSSFIVWCFCAWMGGFSLI